MHLPRLCQFCWLGEKVHRGPGHIGAACRHGMCWDYSAYELQTTHAVWTGLCYGFVTQQIRPLCLWLQSCELQSHARRSSCVSAGTLNPLKNGAGCSGACRGFWPACEQELHAILTEWGWSTGWEVKLSERGDVIRALLMYFHPWPCLRFAPGWMDS